MKTIKYNPSVIEVDLARYLKSIANQLAENISMKLEDVTVNDTEDNTLVKLKLIDADNDRHEVVLTVIQKPDKD